VVVVYKGVHYKFKNIHIYVLYVCLLILLNKTTSFLLLFKYTRV